MFFDQAERCYDVAASLAPDDWRWTYYRAVIQSERGGGEALVDNLRTGVERAPQLGPAWLRLGEAEFKAGRYDEAAAAWQKARDVPAAAAETASPRHVTEVPLSAYASLGLARVSRWSAVTSMPRARCWKRSMPIYAAIRLGASSACRQLPAARARGRGARLVYRAGRLPPYTPYADPVIDELARESRNSIFLLRLASEANLSINAEWSEYLTRRALEFDPSNPEVVAEACQNPPHRRAQRRGARAVRTVPADGARRLSGARAHRQLPQRHGPLR